MRAIWTSVCGTVVLCCAATFMWTAEAAQQDTDFFTQAAEGGLAEAALSNVAVEKAQSEAVKQFARMMVTEHTQANQELTQLAASKNVTLPAALPEKRQRDVARLNGASGADFDREYMKMMVSDHEKTVKLFERQAERGTDADAKAWAAKMLPALQGHLTQARSLYDTTRGTRGGDRGNASNTNSSGNNSSNANRGNNTRQDTNDNAGGTNNSGGNDNGRYSNLRPNVNANANTNTDTGSDRNTNSNSNRGGNSNRGNKNTNSNRGNNSNTGNANNSTVNRR